MIPTLTPEEIEARLRAVSTWKARGYYMDLSEHPTMSIQQLRELAPLAADTIADLRRQLDEAQRAGELAGEEIVGLTTSLRLAKQALEIIAGKRQAADNLMSHVDVARAALAASPPPALADTVPVSREWLRLTAAALLGGQLHSAVLAAEIDRLLLASRQDKP